MAGSALRRPSASPRAVRAAAGIALAAALVSAMAERLDACTGDHKSLLVLSSQRRDFGFSSQDEDRFLADLRRGLDGCLDTYVEYLDAARSADHQYGDILRDFLERKYANRRFDLIVTLQRPALAFMEQYRGRLFAGTPVFFIAGGGTGGTGDAPSWSTAGVLFRVDLRPTVDLALQLQPSLRRIVVISGASPFDLSYQRSAQEQFARYHPRLSFDYLSGLTLGELEARVRALPPNAAVYMMSMTEDRDGNRFDRADATQRIAAASAVPTYSVYAVFLGRGILGGSVADLAIVLRDSVPPLLHALRGQQLERVGITAVDPHRVRVDSREMRRFGIDEARLPLGSVVLFSEPGLWQKHRWTVIAAVAVMLVQAVLIAGLLVQRRRRRTAEGVSRALAGRLLYAQEEERTRIARDLHDGVCQDVAGIGVDLALLRQRTTGLNAGTGATLAELQERAAAVAEDLRLLSHELHPAILQEIGLVAALTAYCGEQRRKGLIQAFAESTPDLEPVDPRVAVVFFRVAQEAVANSIRHGRACSVTIRLSRSGALVRMEIADDGGGFDVRVRRGPTGLGLTSMEERLRLVGGRLRLDSTPGRGTRVVAVAPAQTGVAAPGPARQSHPMADIQATPRTGARDAMGEAQSARGEA
jgi:signal transduction histidine kinase